MFIYQSLSPVASICSNDILLNFNFILIRVIINYKKSPKYIEVLAIFALQIIKTYNHHAKYNQSCNQKKKKKNLLKYSSFGSWYETNEREYCILYMHIVESRSIFVQNSRLSCNYFILVFSSKINIKMRAKF